MARALKQQLRREVAGALKALTTDEIATQSENIHRQVFRHPFFQRATNVAVYLSMAQEATTDAIVKECFARGKRCFVPMYTTQTMDMLEVHSWDDVESLPLTAWHIRQPKDENGRAVALKDAPLDSIVVPGVAFTNDGKRCGRGKGYYDRYVTRCIDYARESQTNVPKLMGLALTPQLFDDIPIDEHDRLMDVVVSPD